MGGTGRWSLAIDFGATTTTAAICDESGAVTPLRMPNGLFTVPSSVLFDGVGCWSGKTLSAPPTGCPTATSRSQGCASASGASL